MNQANVVGLGKWLPKQIRDNSEWPKEFAPNGKAVGDRTFNDIPVGKGNAAQLTEAHLAAEAMDPFLGAVKRYVASETDSAILAETEAGRAALLDAGIDPYEVDAIVSYSVIQDRIGPATSVAVAQRLGATKAFCWSLDTACASPIAQLMTAVGMVESGRAKNVLLTQSHLMLRSFPFLHPAAPGIGDAATAYVVSGEKKRWSVKSVHGNTHGEFYDAVSWLRGQEDRDDPPWWKAGGDFRLGSKNGALAKQLMRDTVLFGAKTISEAALKAGIDVESISLIASVQPRGFIPGAIAQCLGLPDTTASVTFKKYAHIGGCGPVANLLNAIEDKRLKPGTHMAWYAQGAGFTRGAAILSIDSV